MRGGAPGTRETDLLRPMHLVERIHGILLTGGSAFGLDAASGVVRYLEEHGVGFDAGVARIPLVAAAVLFDLAVGSASSRPNAAMGYAACQAAATGPTPEGNVGAGCGATIGKILGMQHATKGGLGTTSARLANGVIVGAIFAVNALGNVIAPRTGQILGGPRHPDTGSLLDTLEIMKTGIAPFTSPFGNTTIGVIATNARLTKEQVNKVAEMAHDGLACAIHPAHTLYDGDTIFALATGQVEADVNMIGAWAAEVAAAAIVRGIRQAKPAGGLPSSSELVKDFFLDWR